MSLEALSWSVQQPVNDPIAKLLLIMLASYSNEHGTATVSYSKLRTLCHIKSNTTLRKKLALLEEQRAIQRTPQVNPQGALDVTAYQLMLPAPTVQPPERKPKRKKITTVRQPIVYPQGLNTNAWHLWITFKADQFNQTYKSPNSETIACNKLIELANGDYQKQQAIVEQSIANTWKGLFPLQENNRHGGQNQANWRTGLASIFSESAGPTPAEGEIIIDADYLDHAKAHRSTAGKTGTGTPTVSPGLPDPGRYESHSGGILPHSDPEADQ